MKKLVLPNGMNIILEKTKSNSITLGVCVKTGSNNEDDSVRGISHFLEHMIFEGTKNRTVQEIVNEIEGVGGEFNAFTDHEITFFYARVLSKFFNRVLDVISDILKNSTFDEKAIEKERKVVLEEINLRYDDPKAYQWLLFEKTLYKNHPTKYPVIGTKESLEKIKRKEIVSYFEKYYTPNNMFVIVTGNFNSNTENKLKKEFVTLKPKKIENKNIIEEFTQDISEQVKEKKEISHSYLIIGFKTVNKTHEDSYALELICAILGFGQCSRIYNEIRIKRGLSYDAGINIDLNKTFGYIAAYASTENKNVDLCRSIILKEFKLENLTDKEIEDAKNIIEGNFLLRNEDTRELAFTLGRFQFFNDAKDFKNYIKNIRKITKNDILRVSKRYFTGKYTEVLLYN